MSVGTFEPIPFNEMLAFDRTLDIYTEFPTRSDAMIASLCLAHSVDSKIMDAVFAIVWNVHFDSKELSLRGTEDVYFHIAKRRCREAVLLTNSGFCEKASFNAFPQPILDGVVDIIGEELEHVSRTFRSKVLGGHGRNGKKAAALRGDLSNMCLVQRSWLFPARRALGRNLELINPSRDTLMRYLRQPSFGARTRHLAIVALDNHDAPHLVRPFRKLLSERLTSLLSINLSVQCCDTVVFTELFPFLPLVRDFKLEVCPNGRNCFWIPATLFSSFACLRCLEYLSLRLYNWSPTELGPDAFPKELAFIARLPNLHSVHLLGYNTSEHLSWTRTNDGVFQLRKLQKDFGRRGRLAREHLFATLNGTTLLLAHVTDLQVQVPGSGNLALPGFLPYSKVLHRLSIVLDDFLSSTAFASIPASTKDLAFEFSTDFRKYPHAECEPWEIFNQRLLAYLTSNGTKNLQSLRVHMHFRK